MHGIHVPSIRCATLSGGNFNRNKNTPAKRMRFLSLIHRPRSHRGHMLKTIVIYVNPCITPSYIQPGYRGGGNARDPWWQSYIKSRSIRLFPHFSRSATVGTQPAQHTTTGHGYKVQSTRVHIVVLHVCMYTHTHMVMSKH